MTINRLDHVNVRTAQLAEMKDWYERVLEMRAGPRPGFSFGGAWMYAGDHPVVHLVEVDKAPGADNADLRLEHFALQASDLPGFLARLKDLDERHHTRTLDDFGIVQVNVYDPDGNHIHVDFPAAEAEGVNL